MEGYLGEKLVTDGTFDCWDESEWAKKWIEDYAQIDGAHHKMWLLDQVQRILLGTKVVVKEASWENGDSEYRFDLDEPSEEYLEWVDRYEDDGEYEWDMGIAP